jgi:type IV secretory pathway VirB4 component
MIINLIACAIAALGIFLLLILYSRIREVNAERKLKKYRSQDEGLSDLLAYAAVVDDGVIVCKNGAFIAAWLYQGNDNESSTDAQREMISIRINQAFSRLGNGWMIHVDAVRRPAPNYIEKGKSHFPDPITAAIDEERRQYFESLGTMYEGYFILTITYYPPLLAQSQFTELMFDDDIKIDPKNNTRELIESFKKSCLNIESHLSTAVKLTRLRGNKQIDEQGKEVTHDDFLRWLQFCVTGINQPIILPTNPMYIDAIIGGQELWSGIIPKIGRKFIQIVAIEGFPMESYPGILSALAELPSEYRWSSRFIFLEPHEAIHHF